ncbi:uncharacterized protein TRIADDRAFT_54077 [Trichoplax adhaerens]|uniref:MalT-like TPR region domain-containing protein n=1 Tax=Trichoplax adhaerens TaxID=10228 RepID=B3RR17_TRIAD|nr:hypothetical protein TRIADDRAFT_54077 [Trichoplax adhaerens]EDV26802.1 hypothetical protein TRIADDRAFT_54077 [Trichoplax adhaerens]|eukprot:XP_002110798.1 hypothetical protein TRIADDRAFT_54077 [Trichoplax adhaerens]
MSFLKAITSKSASFLLRNYSTSCRFLPQKVNTYVHAYTRSIPRYASTNPDRRGSSRIWALVAGLVLAGGAALAYQKMKIENNKKLLMSKPLKEKILDAQKEIKEGNYLKSYKLYHAALEISSCPQSKEADRNKQAFITDQDDNAMIEISLKLSNIYESKGMSKAAEIGYKWCISTAEKNCKGVEYSPDSNALLGMAQESLGMFYYQHRNLAKAKEYLELALTTAKRTVGVDSPQVAIIRNHLCLVYLESGEYDTAEGYIELAIKNAKSQGDDRQVAVYLVNYGFLHFRKGDVTEAAKCLGQIKELKELAPDEELSKNMKSLEMAINGELNEEQLRN